MKGGDETDALSFSARDISQHLHAAGGTSIRAMQGLIHPTFVKIDEVVWLQVGQLLLEASAGLLVSFGVQHRFFFE